MTTFVMGQSISLSLGSGAGAAGGSVSLPINLTSSGGAQTAAMQWTFSYPGGITGVTVAAGSVATNAQKTISCNGNTCLIYGLNQNIIADGLLATATFQVASGSVTSSIPIQMSAVVAASGTGSSIPATGVAGAISVAQPPVISGVTCVTSVLITPANTPCTVSLTGAAEAGGFLVALSSNNVNLSVPSGVIVVAGQTASSFNAAAASVSVDQTAIVTAGSGGSARTVTLSLVGPVRLSSLSCLSAALTTNSSTTCSVSLNRATASPAVVTLSSNKAVLGVPGSVTVSAGQSGANFTLTSGTIVGSQTAVITASYGGSSLPVTLTVTAPVPTADSVTPSGGAGVSQTFSFVFSDSQSATNLTTVAMLIAPALAYPNACFVIYDRIRGTIQLQWDNATGAQSKLLSSTSTLQNSQCSIGATSVTASPLSIAVSIDITFKGAFSGLKNIYSYAADGNGSVNTGWVQQGTYAVVNGAPLPAVDSVTPSAGAGTSQTFSFVFSDSQNAANLSAAAILIAPSLAYPNSCFVIYDRARGTIQLEWDNVGGNAAKLVSSSSSLQNSQCIVGATSVTTSSLTTTISIDITFKSAFAGLKNIFMYGADLDGSINTGWLQEGTYSVNAVSAPVPAADSVTPSGGSGPSQTFSFVFSDSESAANLSAAAILIAPSLTYPNSCFLIYDRNRATIQLEWDNMTGATAKPINSSSPLGNSQCAIGTTSITTSGLTTTITVDVTFKAGFAGVKNMYMYAADTDGTINTGWVQKGTWTSF